MKKKYKPSHFVRESNNLPLTLTVNHLVANFVHSRICFFSLSFFFLLSFFSAACTLRLFQSEHEEIVFKHLHVNETSFLSLSLSGKRSPFLFAAYSLLLHSKCSCSSVCGDVVIVLVKTKGETDMHTRTSKDISVRIHEFF